MRIKLIISAFAMMFLTACNTTNIHPPSTTDKIPPNKVRLVFNRQSAYFGFALNARIFINGTMVGQLANGDSFTYDINPGSFELLIDNAVNPGKFKATFKTEKEKMIEFKVIPNSKTFVTGMVFGIPGYLIHYAVNEDNGVFTLDLNK